MINTSYEQVILEKYAGDPRDRYTLRLHAPVDDECILMQFTGIKDQDGREIYEGDIVRWNHGADDEDNGIAAVEFRAGAFCLASPALYALRVFCRASASDSAKDDVAINIEVVGNIYENPELLQPDRELRLASLHDDRERRQRAS